MKHATIRFQGYDLLCGQGEDERSIALLNARNPGWIATGYRLMVSHNACAGIPTHVLEADAINRMRAKFADLCEIATAFRENAELGRGWTPEHLEGLVYLRKTCDEARALIWEMEGDKE